MKTQFMMAVVGLAASLAGCGGHDTVTLSDYALTISYHLDALGKEQAAHLTEISATSRVESIGPVELGHAERMDDHLDRMSRVMGGMMSCVDANGWSFDAARFAAMAQDLRSECDEHGMLMLSAHDMDTALAEEARHQQAVSKQIDKVRRQMGMMMPTGSDNSTCAPCPSCGM
jgi:hypothetical protein